MTGVLVSVSGSVGTAGCRFFCWDGEGRQREVASVRGVDAVGGVFEVLWVDVVEGCHLPLADVSSRQEKTCGVWKRTGRPVLKC